MINEEMDLENSTEVENPNREVGGGLAERIKHTGRARSQTKPFGYIAPGQPKIDQVFVLTYNSAVQQTLPDYTIQHRSKQYFQPLQQQFSQYQCQQNTPYLC